MVKHIIRTVNKQVVVLQIHRQYGMIQCLDVQHIPELEIKIPGVQMNLSRSRSVVFPPSQESAHEPQ